MPRFHTGLWLRYGPVLELVAPLLWMAACLAFGIGIASHPAVAFQGARRGLVTWWEIVLPSQLPFFIIAELLMNLGFVKLLGTLLEPAMRPLFRLPGSAGYVFTVSYLSGFPLCASLTSRLRSQQLCTRDEGERLVSFTSNASPLFILGAVSVGMFRNPYLGPLIAGIHYLSSFSCGLILRCCSRQESLAGNRPSHRFNDLLERYRNYRRRRHQSFGTLLGDTIKNTALTLLSIGGFITLFSVLISIMQSSGILPFLVRLLGPLASSCHLDPSLLRAILYGCFEITIGINEVSKSQATLWQQLMAVEAILAWNGLAIQAQVAGMMSGSDLKIRRYLGTRLLQIPLAILFTYLCSLLPWRVVPVTTAIEVTFPGFWHNFQRSLALGLVILLALALLSHLLKQCKRN